MGNQGTGASFRIYLHRRHDALCPLVSQFQNTAQDGNFVVLQRFFTFTVKLQERLEFCLLISVGFVPAEDKVEQFGDGPRDGCWVLECA